MTNIINQKISYRALNVQLSYKIVACFYKNAQNSKTTTVIKKSIITKIVT